jgi:hypothetical protein
MIIQDVTMINIMYYYYYYYHHHHHHHHHHQFPAPWYFFP